MLVFKKKNPLDQSSNLPLYFSDKKHDFKFFVLSSFVFQLYLIEINSKYAKYINFLFSKFDFYIFRKKFVNLP